MQRRRDDSEAHFEALVRRLESVGRRAAFADLRELARLYRMHSARLAMLRTRARDRDAIRYLNGLCMRAFNLVYASARRDRRSASFAFVTLPTALARTWKLQALVGAILLASALAGMSLAGGDPRALPALVPAAMYPAEALDELATSADARRQFLAREPASHVSNALFGGYLFINNTRVGLLSFATGILGGIPSLLLVAYNGATLGAFVSIFAPGPEALRFAAWLIPHGIPELLAIVLCSTGGLVLGLAMLAPGREGRAAELRDAGQQALQLVLASIPLFVLAAAIESFVRQSTLSTAARLSIAAGVGALLIGYVVGVRALARRQRGVDVRFLEDAAGADHRSPL